MGQIENQGFSLSPSQKMVWSSLKRGASLCAESTIRIKGSLELEKVLEAFNEMEVAHDLFSMRFEQVKHLKFPLQYRKNEAAGVFTFHDFSDYPDFSTEKEVGKVFERRSTDPHAPKISLVRLEKNVHFLILWFPAILADTYSLLKIVDELLCRSLGTEVPSEIIRHLQFSQWQNNLLNEPEEEAVLFWRRRALDSPKNARISLEQGMPLEGGQREISIFSKALDEAVVTKLRYFASEHSTDIAQVLYLCLNILLFRHKPGPLTVSYLPVQREFEELQDILGPVSKVLPMSVCFTGSENSAEALATLKQVMEDVIGWQDYFSWDYFSYDGIGDTPLPFGFEFVDLDNLLPRAKYGGLTLEVQDFFSDTVAFKVKLLGVKQGGVLRLDFYYDKGFYDEPSITVLQNQFTALLEGILTDPTTPIAALPMLSDYEKQLILSDFNTLPDQGYSEQTVLDLIKAQALANPEVTALRFEDKTWTYGEIESLSNKLSNLLTKRFDLAAEDTVGIVAERSAFSVLAIMAVLKTGAAFVPMDADTPRHRAEYMMRDAEVKVLITDGSQESLGYDNQRVFQLLEEWGKVLDCEEVLCNTLPKSHNLAYIIYTSGSTGQPKGCMVEHKSLLNYISWAGKCYLPSTVRGGFGLFTSHAFDFTLTSIFVPLTTGRMLQVFSQKESLDRVFQSLCTQTTVDIIKLTPSHIHIIERMGVKAPNLKVAIVGGEALTWKHIKALQQVNPKIEIYNEYGPTEATVGCAIWKVSSEVKKVLIGKPITNTNLYILGEGEGLAPIGVEGEICIAGHGLIRGYKNAENGNGQQKFIQLSFPPYQKIYRTGDYGCFLPGGDILYRGRKDHQIKINGFRIEIEEIEQKLLEIDGVSEAAAKYFDDEVQYLAAYIVSEKNLATHMVKTALEEYLPRAVIPQYIVTLEALPLTINGKVNRSVLPDPRPFVISAVYEAPDNEQERLLVGIWEEVIGKDKIGVSDNFFELGGDSIKAILISSKLHKAGFGLEVKELFKYPTIRELAANLKPKNKKANQDVVMGAVELTPIQRDFFSFNKVDPHHYNHAIQLEFKEGLTVDHCNKIFLELTTHHDALRMVFSNEGGEVKQYNLGPTPAFDLKVYDLKGTPNDLEHLRSEINSLQRSIVLEDGPLMKLALFHFEDRDVLTIILHHLVVDGVSWRIILEDIDLLYRKMVCGENVATFNKTDSFRDWANGLRSYVSSAEFRGQIAYWDNLYALQYRLWDRDFTETENRHEHAVTWSFALTEADTEALLTRVDKAFNTQINDVLLTALGLGISDVFQLERIPIMLEGHGREPLIQGTDLSRTVGWFTSEYPVVLTCVKKENLSHQIKRVKEALRAVPQNGIGFGLWKHFFEEGSGHEWWPQVSFNYLGQFDSDIQNKTFEVSNVYLGDMVSPLSPRKYDFEFVGKVVGGKLQFSVTYSAKQYKAETAVHLAQKFKACLLEIIDFCVSQTESSLSPSDLTYKELTIEEVDRLSKYHAIEDVYPLSPLQEGLFYQWLLDRSSEAYFNQISFRVHGDLNLSLFEETINYLVARHDMLRTIFVRDSTDHPLQMVLEKYELKVDFADLSCLSERKREGSIALKKRQEKSRGFNLLEEVPIRVNVFKESDYSYHLVWNIHHIIIDAWCSNILNKEFSAVYESLCRSIKVELPRATQFKTYLKWLNQQETEKAIHYWKRYLEGYRINGLLGKKKEELGFVKKELSFSTGEDLTSDLLLTSQKNQVTLNTLLNTIWGVLLYRICKERDVVFGMIVSGRPPEIEGVEGMMGVTINMLPVRVCWEEHQTVGEVLQTVQRESLESIRYGHTSLAEIQAVSEVGAGLIDHYVDFHNISSDVYDVDAPSGTLVFESVSGEEQSNYDLQLLISSGRELHIVLRYNELIFDQNLVGRIKDTLLRALMMVSTSTELKLKDFDEALTDEQEKHAKLEFSKGLLNREEEDF